MRNRAADEQAAGRTDLSVDFTLFKDLANTIFVSAVTTSSSYNAPTGMGGAEMNAVHLSPTAGKTALPIALSAMSIPTPELRSMEANYVSRGNDMLKITLRPTIGGGLQRQGAKQERIVKVVVHPAEIEMWARRESRRMDEQARSDYAALMWRIADARRRAGRENAAVASSRRRAA
jgi:hypothetical protein